MGSGLEIDNETLKPEQAHPHMLNLGTLIALGNDRFLCTSVALVP